MTSKYLSSGTKSLISWMTLLYLLLFLNCSEEIKIESRSTGENCIPITNFKIDGVNMKRQLELAKWYCYLLNFNNSLPLHTSRGVDTINITAKSIEVVSVEINSDTVICQFVIDPTGNEIFGVGFSGEILLKSDLLLGWGGHGNYIYLSDNIHLCSLIQTWNKELIKSIQATEKVNYWLENNYIFFSQHSITCPLAPND